LNIIEKSLPDLLKVVQQQFVGEVGTFMFLACQAVSRRLDYCNAVLAGMRIADGTSTVLAAPPTLKLPIPNPNPNPKP